ncbi:hypothetical protein HBI56_233180 [Parastagonospora nodorum]|uniref:Cytochrome P450 n=1 Tax=Phaeosphaeria nodorum (strain SN15 / ATCC MYA-4574 / FGSC 10173) TaxID=321614 RepID=A0A7U2FGQ2_PHANO|nr:hypothetical protein HBH56_114400 [Parastagonospora nodorum]QRD04958.1 hypothetical protein JI435_108750 [Parastagonospora nodorum SN15]KAH3929095.1 hypothetical protein HBH54_134750 [Parastagonospora nodorum]KAH3950485.1 hypothetical protein HBH53_075030 [Parastagonospora nodorum]KAH3974100.1 hypothetical protein HBH52_136760 [Parastagonospora nodorum]
MSANTELQLLDLFILSMKAFKNLNFSAVARQQLPLIAIFVTLCLFGSVLYALHQYFSYNDGLPIVNRKFALEPRLFSRIRWAFWSDKILDDAYEKYKGRPYRLARGDADIIVLPDSAIGELNKLPQAAISSRKSHSSSLTGHLNGMDVVKETNHHVKMLLSRVTPALPSLLGDLMYRVQNTITDTLPQSSEEWQAVEPVNKVVHLISKAVTLTTFGAPICDDPDLVRLCYEHTLNIFSIMFVMRLIPRFLQPVLVWLTPFKWRLERSWKRLEGFVIPDVQHRKEDIGTRCVNTDLISCMIREASTEEERDPFMLTRLVGSVIAGGTYSSAAFVVGVIADLVNHPEYLKDIQEEICQVHEDVQGKWDMSAFNRLDKLDSAMKETSRLAPGSLLVYSRYIEQDCVLSSGLQLKKGQFITTSGHSIAMDPEVFPDPRKYDALRSFRNLERHRAQPFRSVEGDDHRWGAGRWACPGRFIASIVSKIILVKLLDEYEFAFIGNKRPATQVMHEFVFMSPNAKMLVRRKKEVLGISY